MTFSRSEFKLRAESDSPVTFLSALLTSAENEISKRLMFV